MKIEIDGILPAVGSMPITEWGIYVDGEKQIIRSFESRGFREFAIEVEPLVVIKKSLEEEKKMLNFDKYRKEISEIVYGEDFFDICRYVYKLREGKECLGYCSKCINDTIKWLSSEYKPPLLENGDGLNPGDWIMVNDDDDGSVTWYKNRFVCYYNATFFVVDDNGNDSFNENGTNITGWKYARLPEEGE